MSGADVRWVLEYFMEQRSESPTVVLETLHEAGAPQGVLNVLYEMAVEEANA
jgi:hypothetical protein